MRKQKVVLRNKVRKERRARWALAAFGAFKGLCFFGAALFGVAVLYRFLFLSDFFMIKSFQVESAGQKLGSGIVCELSGLKGENILKISSKKAERDLLKRFPSIRAVTVKRKWPGTIAVNCALREPLAVLKAAEGSSNLSAATPPRFVDAEGVPFCLEEPQWAEASLPVMVISSGAAHSAAISFLKSWNQDQALFASVSSSAAPIRKITVDSWGEISLILSDSSASQPGVRVVWGEYDPGTFRTKLQRFGDVWADLQRKKMKVEYVNLRDAVSKELSASKEQEMVGRVVVRPAAGENKS